MNISRPQFLEKFMSPETRWIDVRAPVEFSEGAIPGAVNLPLLSDDERHLIGIKYKSCGQEAAIELGNKLVSGAERTARIRQWIEAVEQQSVIYCFRGGLRSKTVQNWLQEKGVDCPIVEGGYKALRQFLQESFTERVARMQFLVVSGPTGSGKTAYLRQTKEPNLDLEKIARHRGSVFGNIDGSQPSQADFENVLFIELLRLFPNEQPILIESESRMIGKCAIPEALMNKIRDSPKLILDVSLENRVERIFEDYIQNSSLGQRRDKSKLSDFKRCVQAISRKLGGARTAEILNDLEFSEKEFDAHGDIDCNRVWIRKLLVWYYDPTYAHHSV